MGRSKNMPSCPHTCPLTRLRADQENAVKLKAPRKIDDKAAALAFEREHRKREGQRRKEEAAIAKERGRREKAAADAQAAIETAKREHEKRASTIEMERARLEKRSQAEDARWEKHKKKLEIALRRARDGNRD
jgi:colicin import membrane protein